MPILDPFLQFKLINQKGIYFESKSKHFFKKYLKVASTTKCSNLNSTLSYIKFKNDFKLSLGFIQKNFGCEFYEENLNVPNLYDLLYNEMKYSDEVDGKFYQVRSINSIFTFFQPYIDFVEYHSWYLTDTPIAILCLRVNNLEIEHFNLIKLEIDLMAASGYILVLIIDIQKMNIQEKIKLRPDGESSGEQLTTFNKLLSEFICDSRFAEVHINNDMNDFSSTFYYVLCQIENLQDCVGYFYIYSQYLHPNNINNTNDLRNLLNQKIKILKTKPRVKIIRFGGPIKLSLKDHQMEPIKPFSYCLNGYLCETIKIILCDVPLYDSVDEKEEPVSTEFADIYNNNYYIGFIRPHDFLYWKKARVEVIFYSQQKSYFYKFVDFDDIHLINQYLYVKHPITLAKVKIDEITAIQSIIQDAHVKFNENENDEFKREFFFSLFKEKKAVQLLKYVLYACKKHIKDFKFFKSQIFVALRAINFCILKQESYGNRGFVYQVATGEGKSFIVVLIAAVLALFKKTVHIVTSNIALANRDYNTYYDFFNFLGLKSAALIHDNEKPDFEKEPYPIIKEHYPDEFYDENNFKNSMKLNFNICGILSNKNKTKANIIFSTLMNFESLYLYMNEKAPGKVDEYYKNSSIVIDEADLILIDELTNGTILSRPMKTNAEEVLTYVYETKTKFKLATAKEIYDHIKAECTDLTIDDVENMFKEIKMVNTDPEFVADKKYAIVPIKQKENSKEKIIKKEIIPFDYDHTGILLRNREFSGFVPQFISLKERHNCEPNEVIVFKDISMNYLYVSHPIYIQLYDHVCGLTGTVGDEIDKKTLKEQYQLSIQKVPRENPNRRYEFPNILCKNITDRNNHIVEEIMHFHKDGWPVLAIFISPKEIDEIEKMIKAHKYFDASKDVVGIYNGKNDKSNPDEMAGQKGAISLGTNVCGRGTHIDIGEKPLHVIVTYYSSNTRAMNQAFGRTARQEKFGTIRVICLSTEYFKETKAYDTKKMLENLQMLDNVNLKQNRFINFFRLKKREWIFDGHIQSQKIPSEYIQELRKIKINVNRINAYDFKFPVCMRIPTFLNIQSQKVFSLLNCPNSKYTWQLFQQYIREMLLESWSLHINEMEKLYNSDILYLEYVKSFNSSLKNLINELLKYLPDEKDKYNIVETFMNIFQIVKKNYKKLILQHYEYINPKDKNSEETNIIGKPKMTRISFGFRPFELKYKSGSRILSFFNIEPDIKYIEDPELKYIKKGSPFCSITEKIDIIFEKILNVISHFLGNHLMFKLFLRRTLAGCEFGICYEVDDDLIGDLMKDVHNCLFDINPLFVFSIYVRSLAPFLAGILILLLLYLTFMGRKLVDISSSSLLVLKNVKKVVVSIAKAVAEKVFEECENKIIDTLCGYLYNAIKEQINKFKFSRPNQYRLMNMLASMLVGKVPDGAEKISDKICDKLKFNTKTIKGKILDQSSRHLFKIGFLMILCGAAFLMNFHANKSINYSRSEVAEKFDKEQKYNMVTEKKIDEYINDHNQILAKEMPNK